MFGLESSSHDSKTEIHVLRESTSVTVIQCKKELGSQADDVLSGTPTFDSLLDFIATERLRSMPHKGSKWDEVLKWAESFARSVDVYSHSISSFIVYSWESARLVWGSCRFLLQVCPSRWLWLSVISDSLLTRFRWVGILLAYSKRSSVSCIGWVTVSTFSFDTKRSSPLPRESNISWLALTATWCRSWPTLASTTRGRILVCNATRVVVSLMLTTSFQVRTSHFPSAISSRASAEELIRSSITKTRLPMKCGLLP